MKNKLILLISILLVLIKHTYAQTENVVPIKRLEIGDPVPNITFNNTNNFPSWLKSTNDLKGKLTILDFWAIGCSVCVEKFPKMDSLQKEFGDNLQIILINSSSEEKKCLDYISKLWDEKMKNAFASLPSTNGDKRWSDYFPHNGVPHHVWIDQEGKVMAITQEWNATREHIKTILSGTKLKFSKKDDLVEYDYAKEGIMKVGHEKLPSPLLYSAFLPEFNGLGGGTFNYIDSLEKSYKILHRNLLASQLYKLVNKKIRCKIETKKIPKVSESKATDEWQAENRFTFEIKVPLSDKENIQKYMLDDLNRFFGMKYNIFGAIETRSVPAYVLRKISSQKALMKVKNKVKLGTLVKNNNEHIVTLTGLKGYFRNYENIDQNKILIDETGINPKDKLDIYLPIDVSNLSTINVVLKEYGLEIISEPRNIELMIVKDK